MYDAIVLGLGGMGSAAFYQLAARGLRVLGLERYDIPHTMGSSHGHTRIIRLAYHENPAYVPLLRRAYHLWRELELTADRRILHQHGSVDVGPDGQGMFTGSLASCRQHDLRHEVLSSRELAARFPGYRFPDHMMAVFQPDGGFLEPEASIVSYVTLGIARGGVARARERVTAWEPAGDGVRVVTERGEYRGRRLVVCGGPWAASLIPRLTALAVPERQALIWLQPSAPALFAPERFPVFNCSVDEGDFYGFPVFGIPGFKFGRYRHLEEQVDPETVDRDCYPRDEAVLRRFAERYFPEGAGPTMSMKACMFTNSPDHDFIIDRLPESPQVSFAAGFSGHGFKFCSVIGEIMADLAERGETGHDIGMFRLSRFG